jgi:hypothetical protein
MAVPLEFVVKANAGQFKAEMAQVKAIAQGMNAGGGGHGGLSGLSAGSGQAGVMRESIVIMREIGRGNWARVPGSISLMLQYMGAFSKILKVTHSDLAQHALDLEKEAAAMAKAAVAESVRNGTSKLQQSAAVAMLAAEKARAAGTADASALTIIAKQREAAAYAAAAAIEGTASTTVLGPIGWVIAAVVALGAAVYFTFNHFKRLSTQQENMAEAMGMGADQTERQTKRMNEQADAARKLAVEIANVHKHQKTLAEISDEAVESLKRNAQAEMELAKSKKQTRLDEIDLYEKMHVISAQTATRQRAEIEIETIKEEQKLRVNALTEEQNQRLQDYAAAKKADADATADYKAKAEISTAAGGQGSANINALSDLKKREDFLSKMADALTAQRQDRAGMIGSGQRERNPPPIKIDGKEMPVQSLESVLAQLAGVRANVARASSTMSGSDVATAEAKAKMEAAAQSKLRLGIDTDKGAQAITDAISNGGRLSAEQIRQAELKRSAKLYEEGQQGVTKGYSLNAQQKVGAYAATPPDFKRLVDAAIRTAQNTDNLKGKSFNPVGSVPMQVGPGGHH